MPQQNNDEALRISEELNVSMLAAQILCARGFKYEDARDFLSLDKEAFYNPLMLNDMKKAIDRIKLAVNCKEKITVYGDYDVDGITATYILYDYLKSLGADVSYYIPDRIEEGYGMNTSAIDTLNSRGITLIITVDVGITAVDEVDYASKLGIDVVITDHHTLKEVLPNAVAVVNPKIPAAGYPFDALAGVGVAFKLIYALSGLDESIFDRYCDIAAVGTVADMVPLTGENRYIASVGIEKLKRTQNQGIKAILQVAGLNPDSITSTDISFGIAPRLNAAGRMSHAGQSVELLLEKDAQSAYRKALKLDECNRLRQAEELKIYNEALSIISQDNLENDSFILVAKDEWAHGIIGIVSSKLTEKFYKPSAVVSINKDGTGKASGRSIRGINLVDALSSCSGELIRFGGHELAAGFTVKQGRIDEFRRAINMHIQPLLTESVSIPSLDIDSVIELKDLTVDTFNSLKVLEPYGIENKVPTLCINDLMIESVRYTQNGKHAFLTVSNGHVTKELPAFGMADEAKCYSQGDYICVAGNLNINEFRGNLRAQFIVRDIHPADTTKMVSRAELAAIFTDIKNNISRKMMNFDDESTISLSPVKKLNINNPKIQTALKIFEELNIINTDTHGASLRICEGINFHLKNDLLQSETYRKYSSK